jgi:hypothetical protein
MDGTKWSPQRHVPHTPSVRNERLADPALLLQLALKRRDALERRVDVRLCSGADEREGFSAQGGGLGVVVALLDGVLGGRARVSMLTE